MTVEKNRFDVALVAYPGGGKSTAADYLTQKWQFAQITGSDVLRRAAQAQRIELTRREDYDRYNRLQQAKRGASFISAAGFALPKGRVTHVGLRNRYDIDAIKRPSETASRIIVGLVCDQSLRYERTIGLDAKYGDSWEAFKAADALENSNDSYGSHVEYGLANANYVIDNTGSIADLQRSLDGIVSTWLESHGVDPVLK